jgi:hypothetical protein
MQRTKNVHEQAEKPIVEFFSGKIKAYFDHEAQDVLSLSTNPTQNEN